MMSEDQAEFVLNSKPDKYFPVPTVQLNPNQCHHYLISDKDKLCLEISEARTYYYPYGAALILISHFGWTRSDTCQDCGFTIGAAANGQGEW